MQGFMQSRSGLPPQQQTPQHQAQSIRQGYVNVKGQIGQTDQPQRQAQQMAFETMTRGQTGARKSPHPINQGFAASMTQFPQLPFQGVSPGLRTGNLSSATTPSPDAASHQNVDSETTGVNIKGPPRVPQVNMHEIQPQPQPQQNPSSAQMDGQAAPQHQTQQHSPSRITRSRTQIQCQARSPQPPQWLTGSQSRLAAELSAQHHSKGPIIGHGPRGPIYLNGPSGNNTNDSRPHSQTQFSVHEDDASGSEAQGQIQSLVSAANRKLGRLRDAEREAGMQAQMQWEEDESFLPR